MSECRCPVCGQEFKTPQGRGGHILHATDAAHKLHRLQRRPQEARRAATAPAAAPLPAPVSAAPAPAPVAAPPLPAPSPAFAVPVPVALPRVSLRPSFGWQAPPAPVPAPPAPTAAPAPVSSSSAWSATTLLKPATAATAGALLGAAIAGDGHRGTGFLLGAGLGLLAWLALQHRQATTLPAPEPRRPPVDVPAAWRGVLAGGWPS